MKGRESNAHDFGIIVIETKFVRDTRNYAEAEDESAKLWNQFDSRPLMHICVHCKFNIIRLMCNIWDSTSQN